MRGQSNLYHDTSCSSLQVGETEIRFQKQNSIYVSMDEDSVSFDLGRIECLFGKGSEPNLRRG